MSDRRYVLLIDRGAGLENFTPELTYTFEEVVRTVDKRRKVNLAAGAAIEEFRIAIVSGRIADPDELASAGAEERLLREISGAAE